MPLLCRHHRCGRNLLSLHCVSRYNYLCYQNSLTHVKCFLLSVCPCPIDNKVRHKLPHFPRLLVLSSRDAQVRISWYHPFKYNSFRISLENLQQSTRNASLLFLVLSFEVSCIPRHFDVLHPCRIYGTCYDVCIQSSHIFLTAFGCFRKIHGAYLMDQNLQLVRR